MIWIIDTNERRAALRSASPPPLIRRWHLVSPEMSKLAMYVSMYLCSVYIYFTE
jgi:hypothetical protein